MIINIMPSFKLVWHMRPTLGSIFPKSNLDFKYCNYNMGSVILLLELRKNFTKEMSY